MASVGNLDLNAQLEQGAEYTFYFQVSSLLDSPTASLISGAVAEDSNFANPLVGYSQGDSIFSTPHFYVKFTYQGGGSNVGDAGSEMQKVISDRVGWWPSFIYFLGGDDGSQTASDNNTNIAESISGSLNKVSSGTWTFAIIGIVLVVVVIGVGFTAHQVKEII